MLSASVAVGISILGLTSVGSATARITQGTDTHRAAVHVINLRKAYEARLGHSTTGKPAGIVYAKGQGPLRGRGGNNCAEPYCPVFYQGGVVQHTPHVYLLLWGPNWLSDPSQEATASYLESFYAGLGGPQDHWSPITSQYHDGTGSPTFPGSVYEGVFNDTHTPTAGATDAELAAEADAFTAEQGITDLNDAQIVIATQSGTCPAEFVASICPTPGDECAYHDSGNVPFTNLPYLLDAGSVCGEDAVNQSTGTYDGFSMVGGHEYGETITDPFPFNGWVDPIDNDAFGEIADKCAWSSQSSDITLSTGTFAMQPLWSNSADGCVMSQIQNGDITVNSPGSQINYQSTKLSLQMIGTSSDGYQLTWTQNGLPLGMTISTGGLISGQVKAPPGTYNVTVSTSDPTVTPPGVKTHFEWKVIPDVGSLVTNKGSGLCLNDDGWLTTPGTRIVMWHCASIGNEKFSHPKNRGKLIVFGQCLTDPNRHGSGQIMAIFPCIASSTDKGYKAQQWYHNSKNEYVLEQNGLCLTDLYNATLNGMPVVITKCTDAKDQQWIGS
jgi:serine protease